MMTLQNELKIDKGVRPGDIKSYDSLSFLAKKRVKERVLRLLESIDVGESSIQSSIAPPHIVNKLWEENVHYKDLRNFQLITTEAFDGGTNFYIKNKS